MEKEQIKLWYKRFLKEETGYTLLKKEITDTTGVLEYEVSDYFSNKEKLCYEWMHELYISATEVLEDESWYVYSASKVDECFILVMKSKKIDNFLIEIYTDTLRNESQIIIVAEFSEFIGKTSSIYSKDVTLLDKEKKQQVGDFFYTWLKTKSKNRLRYILKKTELKL